VWFEARDKQQIDDLDRPVGATNSDCPAGWRNGQHFGMLNEQYSPVCQMNLERLKRAGLMHPAQLFDGHSDYFISVSATRKPREPADDFFEPADDWCGWPHVAALHV